MIKIRGELFLPGDKSIAHRAILFSSISGYKQTFTNFPENDDCLSSVSCMNALGVQTVIEGGIVTVSGRGKYGLKPPLQKLDAGNSGTTIRLLSGILAAQTFATTIAGDPYLNRRPMGRIIKPLREMGAKINASEGDVPPLHFNPSGNLKAISYRLPVASAQVKSCILLAGLYAEGDTNVTEPVATRDHTERMLKLQKEIQPNGDTILRSNNSIEIADISMQIPGDFSSAAFFLAAVLMLPGSELVIKNVGLNERRTGMLNVLRQMGAKIEVQITNDFPEPCGTIYVRYAPLKNITLAGEIIPNIIDELPILSVLAARSEGEFVLQDAAELRVKESDRLALICSNLKRMGVELEEFNDGLRLTGPQKFSAAKIVTGGDHRIAMAFAVAGLISKNEVTLDDPACASVSFPGFYQEMNRLIEK